MTKTITKVCLTEDDLLRVAATLAPVVRGGTVIYLHGPLGAGKTTFTRAFLAALGHQGKVKSPTYAILEQYRLLNKVINHFDLYRILYKEELEQIGIRDYFQSNSISLIEWPEKADGLLPSPDIECNIAFVEKGRSITLSANSERGRELLTRIG